MESPLIDRSRKSRRSLTTVRSQPLSALSMAAALLAASAGIARAEQEILSNDDGMMLTFSVDVIGAGFSATDSWFGESDAFLGTNTDDWAEFGAEPKLALTMPMGEGEFFGEVSGVYTSTYADDASGLTVGLEDKQELTLEQGHIGWRAEDFFENIDGDMFSLTIGRQDYNIGTGLLINDGAGDGGERGGWYLGMRKAFSESTVVSLTTEKWLAEGFNLKNRPREGGTQGQAYGTNVEYTFDFGLMLGGTYMLAKDNLPGNDQADIASARFDWQFDSGLGFSGEYVDQSSDQIDSTGFYGQVSYAVDSSWMPVFSYRYAAFEGDDPTTTLDENFRGIAYGFTDYGSWYQGEITGNYPLSNSNLKSHLVRATMTPKEGITVNALYYQFSLDQPDIFGTSVASDDWGDELDLAVDWEASDNLYLIGVLGILMPGDAAVEWTGGSSDWLQAMLYLSWSW
jgi:hypothetical protein